MKDLLDQGHMKLMHEAPSDFPVYDIPYHVVIKANKTVHS